MCFCSLSGLFLLSSLSCYLGVTSTCCGCKAGDDDDDDSVAVGVVIVV